MWILSISFYYILFKINAQLITVRCVRLHSQRYGKLNSNYMENIVWPTHLSMDTMLNTLVYVTIFNKKNNTNFKNILGLQI